MPKYTRAEFLTAIGKDPKKDQAFISMAVTRGKLVLTPDKKHIDTSKAVNKAYYEEQLARIGKHVPPAPARAESKLFVPGATVDATSAIPLPPVMGQATAAVKKAAESADNEEVSDEELLRIYSEKGFDALMLLRMPATQINRLHKIADILKKDSATSLEEMRLQKMQGDVIPVAPIQSLIFQYKQYIITQEKIAHEKVLAEIGQKYDLTPDDMAYFRNFFIGAINDFIKDADVAFTRDLGTILKEFSIRRGVGERG